MTVLMADASGLETYNSSFFVKIFYALLAGLIGYAILRRYNKKIALLSTGLLGFLYIGNFYTGFIYGWQPQILGSLFLVGTVWAMLNFEKKGS